MPAWSRAHDTNIAHQGDPFMGYQRLYLTTFEFGGDSIVPISSLAMAST